MDFLNKKKLLQVEKALKVTLAENAKLKKDLARLSKENIKLAANQNISGLNARVEKAPNIPSFEVPPVGNTVNTVHEAQSETEAVKSTNKLQFELTE